MATEPRSFDQLYEVYKDEVQAVKPELTDFSDGSVNDINAGAAASLAQEVQRIMLDRFKITYFKGAEGQDLEDLAIDHFGDSFGRPSPAASIGIVEFTRPTAAAGNVLIDAGTIVKTPADANGETQRYATVLPVTMTGTLVSASIIAVVGGPKGDVGPNEITEIESALTDPTIVVNNAAATSGGEPEQDDATYRDTIIRLIQGLKGATKQAILATTLNVPGVVTATAQEFIQTVNEWDEATSNPIGDPFKIARTKLYIADASGTASQALIDTVKTTLFDFRACGVFIEVLAATALPFDWDASITLNPGGPNFAALSNDPQPIVDSMTKHIQDFAIGGDFVRDLARAAILAVWGPAGSDDLTDFSTNVPAGEVSTTETEKLIPGTIGIS